MQVYKYENQIQDHYFVAMLHADDLQLQAAYLLKKKIRSLYHQKQQSLKSYSLKRMNPKRQQTLKLKAILLRKTQMILLL